MKLLLPILILAAIAGIGFVGLKAINDDNNQAPTEIVVTDDQADLLPPVETPSNADEPSANSADTESIPLSEVQRHSIATDCWVIVSGRVFDISALLRNAADQSLSSECGGESSVTTLLTLTDQLEAYYIGSLR